MAVEDENTKLTDCYYEKKDWRACKQEVSGGFFSKLGNRNGAETAQGQASECSFDNNITDSFADGDLPAVLEKAGK